MEKVEDLEIKKVYPFKVVFIAKTHVIAKTLDGNHSGLLHISEISDYYVGSIESMFKVGEIYDFEIVSIDGDKDEEIKLSWKNIAPRFLKDPFEYNIKETKKGFETLKEFVKKEV